MTEWMVNPGTLRGAGIQGINNCAKSLRQIREVVRGQSVSLRLSGYGAYALKRNLQNICGEIDREVTSFGRLSSALENAALRYRDTENRLAGKNTSSVSNRREPDFSAPDANFRWNLWDKFLPASMGVIGAVFGVAGGSDLKGSLYSGSVKADGTLFGMDASVELKGDLLGGSVKNTAKAEWDTKKGNIGAKVGVKASGHLASASIETKTGWNTTKLEGSVGEVGATGELGASLYKDGVLAPSIQGKAKVEAAVAKGKIDITNGSEDFNQHVGASGSVLGANASISGAVGVITKVDEAAGTVTRTIGVEGEVGAEAYLAEGKVSGGFTLFGIKFDAELSGKAGGAGVKAGGELTTGSVSGELGAGLGVGLGIKFSIDWSNFSLW